MEYIIYFLIAVICLFSVGKLLAWPIKLLFKLIANAVIGAILILIVNFFGGYFNFSIGLNWITALIAGFFGVPGVIFLILFKLFM